MPPRRSSPATACPCSCRRSAPGRRGRPAPASARMALEPVPSTRDRTSSRSRCAARSASGWLYVSDDCRLGRPELERIAEPLGRLIDVAIERDRIADQAAEAEAARRAEVAKTAILHAISHDLRSPLTAMTTAGAALRAAGCDRRRARRADRRDRGARVRGWPASSTTSSTCRRSRPMHSQPQADWCDLHDAVASAAMQLQGEPLLEFALPGDLPLVRADAAQLERVFSNLIENAIKFSPPAHAGPDQRRRRRRPRDRPRHRPRARDPAPAPRARV